MAIDADENDDEQEEAPRHGKKIAPITIAGKRSKKATRVYEEKERMRTRLKKKWNVIPKKQKAAPIRNRFFNAAAPDMDDDDDEPSRVVSRKDRLGDPCDHRHCRRRAVCSDDRVL